MNSSRVFRAGLSRISSATDAYKIGQNNGPLLLCRSYIKGVKIRPRMKLNQYKVNLTHLPRLTEHLTKDSIDGSRTPIVEPLDELWRNKLDTYRAFLPIDQKPVLLEALFNPKNDIDKLLRIIDENLITMTSFYVAVSFEALDDMMRHSQCDIETVIVSPELKRLCTRALYKIRFFEADEVLKLLKCLSTIRLPEDVMLSQAAFQMARHLINDYSLEELWALSSCLNSFDIIDHSKKSLLLAVKEAIPVARRNLIKENQYDELEAGASSVEMKVQQNTH